MGDRQKIQRSICIAMEKCGVKVSALYIGLGHGNSDS